MHGGHTQTIDYVDRLCTVSRIFILAFEHVEICKLWLMEGIEKHQLILENIPFFIGFHR